MDFVRRIHAPGIGSSTSELDARAIKGCFTLVIVLNELESVDTDLMLPLMVALASTGIFPKRFILERNFA